ncbi:MAG: DUF1284 domain-containing protein [Lachnospiraceae bacterium]|nr:DUF1284 domain-containing protein [Lachnospiraceae bacterium]
MEYGIRPHHGMCLGFFRGKGYSDGFVAYMVRIKEELEKGQVICLTSGADGICERCPNYQEGACITAEKVSRYDRRVLELCGLQEGDRMSWKAFETLVKEKILDLGHRQEICGDCEWNDLCAQEERKERGVTKP